MKRKTLILTLLAVLILLLMLPLTGCSRTVKLEAEQLVSVSFEGSDGHAVPEFSVNKDYARALLSAKDKKSDPQIINLFLDSVSIKPAEDYKDVKNGDTLKLQITYNDSLAEHAHAALDKTELDYKVENLPPVKDVDVFELAKAEFSGFDTVGTLKLSLPKDFPVAVSFEFEGNQTLKNGDKVDVKAVYDKEAALAAGYTFKTDSRTYTVSGLAELKVLHPLEDAKLEFSGYNGYGRLEIKLPEDYPIYLQCRVENNGQLKNDEDAVITYDYYNSTQAAALGYKLESDKDTVKVKDLAPLTIITADDLYKHMSFSAEGISPLITVSASLDDTVSSLLRLQKAPEQQNRERYAAGETVRYLVTCSDPELLGMDGEALENSEEHLDFELKNEDFAHYLLDPEEAQKLIGDQLKQAIADGMDFIISESTDVMYIDRTRHEKNTIQLEKLTGAWLAVTTSEIDSYIAPNTLSYVVVMGKFSGKDKKGADLGDMYGAVILRDVVVNPDGSVSIEDTDYYMESWQHLARENDVFQKSVNGLKDKFIVTELKLEP